MGEQVWKRGERIEEDLAVACDAGEDERALDLNEGLTGTFFCEAAVQTAFTGDGGERFQPGFVGVGERGCKFGGTAAEGEGVEDTRLGAIGVEDAEFASNGFDAVGGRAGAVERGEDVGFEPQADVGGGGQGDVFFAAGEAVVEAGLFEA